MVKIFCAAAVWLLWASASKAEKVVREWDFSKGTLGWSPSLMKNIHVEGEALVFETIAGDIQFTSPVFEPVVASPWQVIELTLQSDVSGRAEFFWTNTTQSQYQGFSPGKETPFQIVAGEEKTYRIQPFWQGEKNIIRLRLDLPEAKGGRFALKKVRIIDEAPPDVTILPVRDLSLDPEHGWQARVSLRADDFEFVTLRMLAESDEPSPAGTLSFASSIVNGLHTISFPVRPDGLMHTYNIDVGANANWKGEIIALRLATHFSGKSKVKVESISVGRDPQGSPDLEVTYFGLHDPVTRAGKPARLIALVRNMGGEPARSVRPRVLLQGARLLKEESAPNVIEFGVPESFTWLVQADKPAKAQATLLLEGQKPIKADLEFTPPKQLPKMDYVPEPKPAKSDYQVGVYYFPGWNSPSSWEPIRLFPERQPLLGWYREGDPEVADWQIKWAVEHGISFFLYDWYWDRGARHLEHGLHSALFNARYQNLIKFCLLYANHNSPGSHSPKDCEEVCRYWIDNYFKRPNYLKVNNQPLVVYFAPFNLIRDMGAEATRRSFDRMREMCREAGFGGLYLVACFNGDLNLLSQLKNVGFDAVTGYNWPHANMTAEEMTALRSPYAKCIEGYREMWESIARSNTIKLIPPVSGGWDSRPWHGERALNRFGRTPELFKQHLLDCKRFLDEQEQEPKLKMLFIEAWNEWGEGSYIEPHREFGFGYLEAIRQVFAPSSPKPAEILPIDIGRGPYEFPEQPPATEWDFAKSDERLGWSGNVADLRVEDKALRFTTRGRDPILMSPRLRLRASEFPFIILRLKASRDIEGQVFWATATSVISEGNSIRFPIKGDGEFHDVKVRLADNPRWRGIITALRFDPGSEDGVEVAIESIRLGKE